mmetsp:Transcript_96456/g.241883  ORF Transcript_96456/g.241883 Transcript_96456/m.241883 type:complete len:246 (-) Transcript_96456:1600-2337(-)
MGQRDPRLRELEPSHGPVPCLGSDLRLEEDRPLGPPQGGHKPRAGAAQEPHGGVPLGAIRLPGFDDREGLGHRKDIDDIPGELSAAQERDGDLRGRAVLLQPRHRRQGGLGADRLRLRRHARGDDPADLPDLAEARHPLRRHQDAQPLGAAPAVDGGAVQLRHGAPLVGFQPQYGDVGAHDAAEDRSRVQRGTLGEADYFLHVRHQRCLQNRGRPCCQGPLPSVPRQVQGVDVLLVVELARGWQR